ncbi:hypothetical protein [Alistipes putredinis]|uniref:hypothetical protein n=1 Tax=Alistipes putredinis TaxID=28117 RepID=UPI003AF0B211
MTLVDFYRNVSNFTYFEWRDGSDSFVRFRVYSNAFFDLGFKVSVVPAGKSAYVTYYEVCMDFTEFEKLLKFLIDK